MSEIVIPTTNHAKKISTSMMALQTNVHGDGMELPHPCYFSEAVA